MVGPASGHFYSGDGFTIAIAAVAHHAGFKDTPVAAAAAFFLMCSSVCAVKQEQSGGARGKKAKQETF